MDKKAAANTLVGSAVLTACLLLLPLGRAILVPVHLLGTHVHEAGHALAALLTGGSVGAIVVRADGSGVTPVAGGWPIVVASAGYVGTMVTGAALVAAGAKAKLAGRALLLFGALLGAVSLLYLRGDLVGLATGWGWSLALVVAGLRLRGETVQFASQFLGIVLSLASLSALRDLFFAGLGPGVHSDATNMARLTGIPAVFWAYAWALGGIVLVFTILRTRWRSASRPKQKTYT